MSKLVSINLDVTKIPRDRIIAGKKGKYIDLDVWIDDEADQYGNDASVSVRQTKEEREAKARKTYVGNGKKLVGWGDSKPEQPKGHESWDEFDKKEAEDGDDIPF